MQHIGIRELHLKTGAWVRRAGLGEGAIITDRGQPVASLVPFRHADLARPFRHRRLLPEFEALPVVAGDASADVSADRASR